MQDYSAFYKAMSDHYRHRARSLEDERAALFEVSITLIKALAESESDGSGIDSLKRLGELQANNLMAIIEAR